MLDVVILAAGKGTRMRSKQPKVMHHLAGKPLLAHVLETAKSLDARSIQIVVGHQAELIEGKFVDQECEFVHQSEQLGTGHAVMQAVPKLNDDAVTLVLYGDVPLLSVETLTKLTNAAENEALALLTVELAEPHGYGRIQRNSQGQVVAIIEQKDASPEQLAIREVNTGVMAVKGQLLKKWLPELSNRNAQGEYYLTDVIELAFRQGIAIQTQNPMSEAEVLGVNDRAQLAHLERFHQAQTAIRLMAEGVSLSDPARFDCRGQLSTGIDCSIDINCIFEGTVVLGDNVTIEANCVIRDSIIGSHTHIYANSVIDGAEIQRYCNIGPFARIRPQSKFDEGVRIGNFVETKKVHVALGSKINHLSYVGDAEVGRHVNIGAGTITCNYDGANKHQTVLGDDVFVGSNSALVAPVKIQNGATIAAGSTVTNHVGERQLAVARQRQKNIDGWQRPQKATTKDDY